MEQISPCSVEYYVRFVPGEIRARLVALGDDRNLAVALVVFWADERMTLPKIAAALNLTVMAARPSLVALVRAGVLFRKVAKMADGFDDEKAWYEMSTSSRRLVEMLFDVSYPRRWFDPPA